MCVYVCVWFFYLNESTPKVHELGPNFETQCKLLIETQTIEHVFSRNSLFIKQN